MTTSKTTTKTVVKITTKVRMPMICLVVDLAATKIHASTVIHEYGVATNAAHKMRAEISVYALTVRIINLCLATALHEEQVAYAHWRANRPSRAS